jgi:hypothetical protein
MAPVTPLDLIWTGNELKNLDLWANLTLLGAATLIAYPFLQLAVASRCRGGWRLLALLPLVSTVPVIAYALWQVARGADLWFLPSIYVMPPATVYLLIVGAVHWFMRARSPLYAR